MPTAPLRERATVPARTTGGALERRQDSTVQKTVYSTRSVSNSEVVTRQVSSTVAAPGPPSSPPNSGPGQQVVEKHHTNTGAVAGGVVGGVVGAALLALIAFLIWRKRRNSRTTRRLDEMFAESGVGGGGVDRRTRARLERDNWASQAETSPYLADAGSMTPVQAASATNVGMFPGSPPQWPSNQMYQVPQRTSTDGLLASPASVPYNIKPDGGAERMEVSDTNTAPAQVIAAVPAMPAMPAIPAMAAIPTEPAQPAQPTQPAQSAPPTQPAQSAPPVQPAQPAPPVQQVQPAPPAMPAASTMQRIPPTATTPVSAVPSVARTAGDETVLTPLSEFMWLPQGTVQERFASIQPGGESGSNQKQSAMNEEQEIANNLWRSTGTLRVANAV